MTSDKLPKMFQYETSETSSKTRSENLSEHNSINFGSVLRQVLNLFQKLVSELTSETFLKTLTTVQNDIRNSLLKIQNGLLQHPVLRATLMFLVVSKLPARKRASSASWSALALPLK
jgi:hypothetical protein